MTGRAEDQFPLDPEEHEAQLAGLLELLGPSPRRVLDIGAGRGRIALPLAEAGHSVCAVDIDTEALKECEHRKITICHADALEAGEGFGAGEPYDVALCLGNTFMLFADPERTVGLMRRLREAVVPGGFFAIDDFPGHVWRDIAEGNWQEGVDPEGRTMLVWGEADNVIAFRHGEGDDLGEPEIGASDTPLRLWSMGELGLLAFACGWKQPRRRTQEHLILFTRPPVLTGA